MSKLTIRLKGTKYRLVNYNSGLIAKKPLSGKPIDNGGYDTIIKADQERRKRSDKTKHK